MTKTTEPNLMRDAGQYAESLYQVLEDEYQAMFDRNITLFQELAQKKSGLLDGLSTLEPILAGHFASDDLSHNAIAVKQLLTRCHERNQRNRTFALVEIDQNRKSLKLLREMLQLETVAVYNAEGALSADQSKRYLGSA